MKHLIGFVLGVLALVFFLAACSEGFQVTPTDPTQDRQDTVTTTSTTTSTTSTTTTTMVIVPPPTTQRPRPPGGNIDCPHYGGRFSTHQQIISYAEATNDPSCIRVDRVLIRTGFGPCVECSTDGYTPPPSTTSTTQMPDPGPTTTTRMEGWPTTTTRPGAPQPRP